MEKTTFTRDILPLLSPNIRNCLSGLSQPIIKELEEIRIGVGRPVFLCWQNKEKIIGEGDSLYKVTVGDITKTLQIISKSSLYAFEEELKQGYITVPGGHRVGLTGRAVLEGGNVKRLTFISALNVRIARQIIGAASSVFPYLINRRQNKFYHTLLISGPKKGKTTLLRDIVRLISSGNSLMPPKRVGVVDERSEIASSFQGIHQLDVGLRTEVLDACPKAEGIMMMIRAMSPDVIVTDEIGREEDVYALHEAINAGVVVITSAHAGSFAELQNRPVLARLLREKFFERIVLLGSSRGVGTIEEIFDATGRSVKREGWLHVR